MSPDPVAGTLLARTGDLADANVRLQRAGVARRLRSRITAVGRGQVARRRRVDRRDRSACPRRSLVDCGHRLPDDELCTWLSATRASARAGDCVAPRTVHEAILEGRRAALALLGARAPIGRAGVSE